MTDTAMSLDGKRVVVIGGASGIGFAVAELARAQGAAVVIGFEHRGKCQRGRRAPARCDRAHRRSARRGQRCRLLRSARRVRSSGDNGRRLGRIDVLRLLSATSTWRRRGSASKVRFWGALAAVKHGCRTIARDGSITLTSGMLTHRPRKGAPIATAVAGAVEHLARGLAMDLIPVRVNAVCPGIVLTDHVKQNAGNHAAIDRSAPARAPRRVASGGREGLCLPHAQRLCDGPNPASRWRRPGGLRRRLCGLTCRACWLQLMYRRTPASAACFAPPRLKRLCRDCRGARREPPDDVCRWQRRKARACWSR